MIVLVILLALSGLAWWLLQGGQGRDMSDFSTDDIVVGVEIPGVYDGTCVWLLKDGRLINRMASWGGRREQATREWIESNGDKFARRVGN